jgi:chromate transporter
MGLAAHRSAGSLRAMTTLTLADALPLFGHFLVLSLLAIGGAIVVVPEMHRLMVGQLHLLDDAQFNASVALAQAAPGPNVLFVAVLGYQAAGLAGAAVTLAGIMLPSTLLAVGATRWAQARQHRIGIRAFKAGLAPITIALLAATGWVLTAQNPAPPVIVLTAITALLAWRTRIHVLWLIAAGAIAGAAGLV